MQYFGKRWTNENHTHLHVMFRAWPRFSGYPGFPVPAPGRHKDPRYAAAMAYSEEVLHKWDRRRAYGKARLELCRFIAENW